MKNPPFSRSARKLIGDFRGLPLDEPAKMRRRETKDLASVIEELRIRHGIGRTTPEQSLRDLWSELVGAANASYSHPARIDYGRRLIVAVSHSVVRNELFLHRAAIVERIQKVPGCAGVT